MFLSRGVERVRRGRKFVGFAPLGEADGPVKRKILGLNSAGHYGINVTEAEESLNKDALSAKKNEYLEAGLERSNLAYGFIAKRI